MASLKTVTKPIFITGIDPEREAEKSKLPDRLTEGSYLNQNDDGILIAKGLSEYLKAGVGDTIALIGQGYHGGSAVGLFPVRGIVKLITSEMDNNFIYMTLPAAQTFIDLPDGYSGILIALNSAENTEETIAEIGNRIDTQTYDLLPWTFTMERLLQQAQSDEAFSVVLLFILYVIVGFGILGTVIMMTNERQREFGVIISLGMQRRRLAIIVAVEMLLITLAGVLLGCGVSIPLVQWFHYHPIPMSGEMADYMMEMGMEAVMPAANHPSIFINQALTVTFITIITTLYPVLKIRKLNIIAVTRL